MLRKTQSAALMSEAN